MNIGAAVPGLALKCYLERDQAALYFHIVLRTGNKRKLRLIGEALMVLTLGAAFPILNGRITTWVDSPGFLVMLNRETSKGLKLEGHYSSIHRVGWLGMQANSFTGTNGLKTIVSLQANAISVMFNPWGTVLRRWEIDSIHIKSGSVMLQKTKVSVNVEKQFPSPPWWALFWPDRFYLTDVRVDDANILWRLRNKESGIYHTFLEITPKGRDFEYDARGGELKTPVTPNLEVQYAHVLVRKPRLYCSEFLLGDDTAHPERRLRAQGDAGLEEDRSIHLQVDLTALRVSPWMPEKLRHHVRGLVSGHLEYASLDTGLDTATGHGHLTVANGVLYGLAIVHRYVTLTGSPDPGDMALKVFQADVRWREGAITVENLKMECEGVFRLEGTITISKDQALGGEIELGLTDPYLQWLPTATQTIFTRDEGPYYFTTVHLSGTVDDPEQDLSSRLAKEAEKSPMVELKLFFNQVSEWFHF